MALTCDYSYLVRFTYHESYTILQAKGLSTFRVIKLDNYCTADISITQDVPHGGYSVEFNLLCVHMSIHACVGEEKLHFSIVWDALLIRKRKD